MEENEDVARARVVSGVFSMGEEEAVEEDGGSEEKGVELEEPCVFEEVADEAVELGTLVVLDEVAIGDAPLKTVVFGGRRRRGRNAGFLREIGRIEGGEKER